VLAGLGRTGAVVALAAAVGFAGATALSCAIDRGCIVTRGERTVRESGCGPGNIEVRGRLVDAETGAPVKRDRVYVHAFNDATKVQVSLEPDKTASSFELRLPSPEIRLRVYDMDRVHALFEKNFTAPADGKLDVEVRLEPTHWIRLHGHFYYREDGKVRPVDHGEPSIDNRPRIGGSPIIHIGPRSSVYYDDDGAYSLLVPRELLKIGMVDTPCHPVPAELDLRGATGDEREFDLYLER
jgi:hypothetical protein